MDNKPMFKAGDDVSVHLGYGDDGRDLGWVDAKYRSPFYAAHMTVMNDTGFCLVANEHEIKHRTDYATYDGGEAQYRADLATLDAAAELSKAATGGGNWEHGNGDIFTRVPSQDPNDLPVYVTVIECIGEGTVSFNSEVDEQLIVNAARVASAWARMSAYLRGKGLL